LLNDRVEKQICEYLRKGASLVDAALMTGIGERTVMEWRGRGMEDADSRFGKFFLRTEQARTEWKTKAILTVATTDRGCWRLLCSRFPHEFRNYISTELTGPDQTPLFPSPENPFLVKIELDPDEPLPRKPFVIVELDGSRREVPGLLEEMQAEESKKLQMPPRSS
jgi:hypothetical protein